MHRTEDSLAGAGSAAAETVEVTLQTPAQTLLNSILLDLPAAVGGGSLLYELKAVGPKPQARRAVEALRLNRPVRLSLGRKWAPAGGDLSSEAAAVRGAEALSRRERLPRGATR